jgi:hypothetical protein
MDDNFEANKEAWKTARQDLKDTLEAHGESIHGYGKTAMAEKIVELLERKPAPATTA